MITKKLFPGEFFSVSKYTNFNSFYFIFLKNNMFFLLSVYQFININFCSDMSWNVF